MQALEGWRLGFSRLIHNSTRSHQRRTIFQIPRNEYSFFFFFLKCSKDIFFFQEFKQEERSLTAPQRVGNGNSFVQVKCWNWSLDILTLLQCPRNVREKFFWYFLTYPPLTIDELLSNKILLFLTETQIKTFLPTIFFIPIKIARERDKASKDKVIEQDNINYKLYLTLCTRM